MRVKQKLFGSYSSYRKFLFIFDNSDESWISKLGGYSHVSIAEYINGELVCFDPLIGHAFIYPVMPALLLTKTVLEVKVKYKHKNRLIRFGIQSCSTIVQYMAGISLGALTAEGLYRALTERDTAYLESKGIIEVKPWADGCCQSLD